MIRQLLTLFLLLSFSVFYAQDKVGLLINEGIKLHDQGDYKGAIEYYQEALNLDPKNVMANYETAYSYDLAGDFEKSIEFGTKALKYSDNKLVEGFVVIANAYDHAGKPRKAIAMYKKGLKHFPEEQLLHYNLALTLFNTGEYHESFNHTEQSLFINYGHYNSNSIMNELMKISTNKVSAIFPKYFMLLLNNDNAIKQKKIYAELIELMNQSIKRNDDKNVTIYLSPQDSEKIVLSHQLNTIIALFAASLKDGIPENFEKYADFNTMIFDELVRWKESDNRIKDPSLAFENIYYPYFINLHKSGHTEAFTYFILEGLDIPGIKEWKEKNDQKLIKFIDWSNE